jgi:phage terminase large subunit-like protein
VVVAGRAGGCAWVLEDATAAGLSPGGWAGRVAAAAERAGRLGPAEVVAEANQGGEMVRAVLTGAGLEPSKVRLCTRAGQGGAGGAGGAAL